MSFQDLAKQRLSVRVLVALVEAGADGPNPLGLPITKFSLTDHVITGSFRVLSIDDVLLCDQTLIVNLEIDATAAPPVCGETNVFEVLIPKTSNVPFASLTYAPSILEAIHGCDADGGASCSGSFDPISRTITLTSEVHAKVKCNHVTIFDASGTVTLSKNLNELTPCAGFDVSAGPFGVRGNMCYEVTQIHIKDIKPYVSVGGDEYDLDGVPDVFIPIPQGAASSCGCHSG
jgi:hypothetical protein